MQEKTKQNILFLVKFFAIFGVLEYLILNIPLIFFENWIAFLQEMLLNVPRQGNSLMVNGTAFVITESCTGLVSSAILAATIFSFNKPEFSKKIQIFLAGFVLLLPLNIVRVYGVILIGKTWSIEAAVNAHIISWLAMSLAILALWYYLTVKMNGKNLEELL